MVRPRLGLGFMWSGWLQSPDAVVGTGGTTLSTTLRLNLTLASTQLIKQLHFIFIIIILHIGNVLIYPLLMILAWFPNAVFFFMTHRLANLILDGVNVDDNLYTFFRLQPYLLCESMSVSMSNLKRSITLYWWCLISSGVLH